MKKSVLDAFFPVDSSRIQGLKPGSLVRFSAPKPLRVEASGSMAFLVYRLPSASYLVISYCRQSIIETAKSILDGAFLPFLKNLRFGSAAPVHFGQVELSTNRLILIDGFFWLPGEAAPLLEKLVHKPKKVTPAKADKGMPRKLDTALQLYDLSKKDSASKLVPFLRGESRLTYEEIEKLSSKDGKKAKVLHILRKSR